MAGKADATTVTKPDYAELGASGTNLVSGIVAEETVPALRGQQAYITYRGMRFDATGSAIHKAIELPIRSCRWFVNPASDDPKDVEMADFVHSVLWDFGGQSFDDVVRLALLSLVYGFSILEIIYAPIDFGEFKGKVGWDNLALRQANSLWTWNEDMINGRRQLVSMTQLAPPQFRRIDIPRNKFLLWVNEQEGTDYNGHSIFRAAYKDYFLRDRFYRIRAIGLERGYMGVPVASLPDNYDDQMRNLAQQIVTTIRSDESAGVVKPQSLGLEIVQWALQAGAADSAIQWHNRQMLASCLAQFLDLGSTGRTGSFALSADQSDLFQEAIGATANYFAQVMNLEPGIPSLIGINYSDIDRTKMPRLEHGDIGQRAVQELAAALGPLAQAGFITPDPATEDRLRKMFDLPEREGAITAEALADLIPEVLPHQPEFGQVLPKQPAAPAPAGGGPVPPSGQRSARGQQGQGPDVNAQTPPQGQASGQPRSTAPAGLNAAELVEWQHAYGSLQDLLARKPWPRPTGRPTDEQRAAMRATEKFTEALEGVYSLYTHQGKPPKPSEVVARRRRAYAVRFSFADAVGEKEAPQRGIAQQYKQHLADAMRGKVRALPGSKR